MLAPRRGQILHEALESITNALGETGQSVHREAGLVPVLVRLGGLTAVLRRAADNACSQLRDNPRVTHQSPEILQDIDQELPFLRQRLQILLTEFRFDTPGRVQVVGDQRGRSRPPLAYGSYAEVVLRHNALDWIGKADLINLSKDSCEILDFKTGEPSEHHGDQLRAYALLWARDSGRNPSGRLASQLRLVYPNMVKDVSPPTSEELIVLEEEILGRTQKAKLSLLERPPAARPSVDTCRWCDVKQLCGEYWKAETQMRLAGSNEPSQTWCDLEVQVLRQVGSSSWRGIVMAGSSLAERTEILIRTHPDDLHFTPMLTGGKRCRLIDARVVPAADESSGLSVVMIGASSELYEL